MAVQVNNPYENIRFFNKDGPVFNGPIYIGEAGKNPKQFPQQCYAKLGDDSSVMLPSSVDTPILYTGSGGVPVYNGVPVIITTGTDYSILVEDKNGAQVYYNEFNTGRNQGDGSTVIDDFEQQSQASLDAFNTEKDELFDDFEQTADNLVYSVGFNIKGVFAAGVQIDTVQDALWYDDGSGAELFAIASDETLPYTTTANNPTADAANWRNVTLQDAKTVARSLNVKDNEVIYHDDTVTVLDDIKVIYDKSANQAAWYKPAGLPGGATVSTVIGNKLTYNPGAVEVTMGPAVLSQTVSISDFGANPSETEAVNTAAIQAAIDTGAKQIFRPDGEYHVTNIVYGYDVTFTGPGRIIPSSESQTNVYGSLVRAGTKIGNTNPLDKHGGFVIGGEDESGHGVLIKSQYNASFDVISSRESNPLEMQLYPNASTGRVNGDGSGRVTFVAGFNGSLSNVKVGDVFWVDDTEYEVATIVDANTIDLINIPGGGAASIPAGEHGGYYLYITSDTTVDIVGTAVTWVSGDQFQSWGSDHNVIIGGVRYDATVNNEKSLTLSVAPGDTSGAVITFKFLSDEKFCEIFRLQRMLGQGVEETFSLAARPDMYKFRVGATGSSAGRQSPVIFEQKAPDDDPFPNNDDGRNILALDNSGNVGIHKTDPIASLHIKRIYNSNQGDNDAAKLLTRFEHEWQNGTGSRRSLDIIASNNFDAIRMQGKSGVNLDSGSDIEMQTSGGKLKIGQPTAVDTTVSMEIYNTIRMAELPVFETNGDAITGGLGVGDFYRKSTGELMVRF